MLSPLTTPAGTMYIDRSRVCAITPFQPEPNRPPVVGACAIYLVGIGALAIQSSPEAAAVWVNTGQLPAAANGIAGRITTEDH
jgi:hypothetical protein